MKTVDDMVRDEILCCVSGLVSDVYRLVCNADLRVVLQQTSFKEDDLRALMEREDWEIPVEEHIKGFDRDQLIDDLDDANATDDRSPTDIAVAACEEFARLLAAGEVDPLDGDSAEDLLDKWPGISDDDLRAKLYAHLEENDDLADYGRESDLDCEFAEVYEHWAVTSWLASKLRERGEVVGDFGNLTVWGRCTTGQMISMDHVIQEIYKEMMR